MYKKTILIFLLGLPLWVQGQDFKTGLSINGYLDTYHAVRTEKPGDFMTSRTRLRGEISKSFEQSSFFLSFNLNQNSLLEDRDGFELREAYFDYSSSKWNLRAGRQIIIWGSADGLRITDQISPMDMTEFLARDYDDIRMPVEALKISYFLENTKIELIYVPIFKSYIIPNNPDNPWSMIPPKIGPTKVELQAENRPSKKIANGEIGGRIVFNLPSIDFSLSALHTFNKMPVYSQVKRKETILFTPSYHRTTMFGASLSKPSNNFVFRLETAYNINKASVNDRKPWIIQKKNVFNSLLGIDWYPANEWILSCQYNLDDDNSLLTTNISKKLLNSTLQVSNMLYYDLSNNSLFSRTNGDYALTDQIHLIAGYDLFHGDKGIFGHYKHNSEFYLKAKYNF